MGEFVVIIGFNSLCLSAVDDALVLPVQSKRPCFNSLCLSAVDDAR